MFLKSSFIEKYLHIPIRYMLCTHYSKKQLFKCEDFQTNRYFIIYIYYNLIWIERDVGGFFFNGRLEKKILIYFQYNFTFSRLSPLGQRWGPSLKKLESPPPKDTLCQVWLKLAQWFWRKCKKFRRTDRRQTTGDQKSSFELSAQAN